MSIFRDFFVKEKPVFTGITRGLGGFGFGAAAGGGGGGGAFTGASGGTITTPGNGKKYHFITAPGQNFEVSGGPLTVDYIVIAGGGSGGSYQSAYLSGVRGTPSTFNSETAVGGGGGVAYSKDAAGASERNGGSGGGRGGVAPAGFGAGENFPGPTQQGFPGGDQGGTDGGGGGGGAGGVGLNAPSSTQPGAGGLGKAAFSGDTGIPPSYGVSHPSSAGRWFAGGGGGGSRPAGAPGGIGGGGAGGAASQGGTGTTNTGGGGGAGETGVGAGHGGGGAGGYIEKTSQTLSAATYPITVGAGAGKPQPSAGAGGPGIVIIRYSV
jgi:hypothetical protein